MLLHFTRTFDALASILNTGFLYLHNETGVLGPAAREAFGIEIADDQSSGMICFTEMSAAEASPHRAKYGQYGVGISKQWLIKQGARRVQYVEVGSATYRNYVREMQRSAPSEIRGRPIREVLTDPTACFDAKVALTSPGFARFHGASDTYLSLLRRLQWTQTSRDTAEREWRVRNPRPYAFEGRPSRKDAIDLLLNALNNPSIPEHANGLLKTTVDMKTVLACTGRASLALSVPLKEVRAIFCTSEYQPMIEGLLARDDIRHIKVFA
jgi:hypothetical protein